MTKLTKQTKFTNQLTSKLSKVIAEHNPEVAIYHLLFSDGVFSRMWLMDVCGMLYLSGYSIDELSIIISPEGNEVWIMNDDDKAVFWAALK
jgi:hypothetical protein